MSLDGLDVQRLMWGGGHLCPLPLGSSAFGDGFIQSEVLLLQKVFDRISVEKAFDDLIFLVQSSEQNLQVLASSRRLTRKSSNVSPGC